VFLESPCQRMSTYMISPHSSSVTKGWDYLLSFNSAQIVFPSSSPASNSPSQKCPFSSDKKRHFERPNLGTDSKNLAKHPQKWFTRHLVHAFSIFGRVSSQFLKIMFLEVFWGRFTLLKGQKLQRAGRGGQTHHYKKTNIFSCFPYKTTIETT